MLLHMQGHGPSLGLKYKFACNSTVVIAGNLAGGREFYYGALVDGVTHVGTPLSAEGVWSESIRVFREENRARAIATAGAQFATDFLSLPAIDYFWLAFVREYSPLAREIDLLCRPASRVWCSNKPLRT